MLHSWSMFPGLHTSVAVCQTPHTWWWLQKFQWLCLPPSWHCACGSVPEVKLWRQATEKWECICVNTLPPVLCSPNCTTASLHFFLHHLKLLVETVGRTDGAWGISPQPPRDSLFSSQSLNGTVITVSWTRKSSQGSSTSYTCRSPGVSIADTAFSLELKKEQPLNIIS